MEKIKELSYFFNFDISIYSQRFICSTILVFEFVLVF